LATAQQKTRWMVRSVIVVAGFLVVMFYYGPQIFGGGAGEGIDRAALAKVAPAMTDKAYHRNYRSEDQCITCHTQQVLGAPRMPHEPRARCSECHKIAA